MKTHLIALLGLIISCSANAAGQHLNYDVNGKSYQGYYISQASDAPLVLLIHDWDGLTDYEITRANMLADMGYSVFAADLFGTGIRPTKMQDKRQHTGELYKDRTKMRNLLTSALNIAKAQGANTSNTVVMGYCFGGAAVLEMARSGAKVKGFATFHGGLSTPKDQNYSQTEGKLLIMHGSADTAITMSSFAALATELESNKIDHEMITYSGAPHAFTVFNSDRYREDADKKSWQRFTDFLSEVTQ
ncbi:dienelactone hydrolase family protein [Neptunomonas sp.]|uniref:dienelactone hydrolase family protein n=1 Tax=Neptunomonas sp. TaxID=1971898 RepID=UPI0025E54B18|nr:dienelactone hydrolase family protein [Neptunomonas sp.]